MRYDKTSLKGSEEKGTFYSSVYERSTRRLGYKGKAGYQLRWKVKIEDIPT